MLVEDHLRLQSKLYMRGCSSSIVQETMSFHSSTSGDSIALSLNILASMDNANGQISIAITEQLTVVAAAEPYESVSCVFVSYGSYIRDVSEGWKYESQLWYGVGLPEDTSEFGGGGSGWESWKSTLEKDANGNSIELPLINKSMSMLQALLLDDSGLGGGLSIGGGSGIGMGSMSTLYQLLDSDQTFLCMLRMVLVSLREDDGKDHTLMRHVDTEDGLKEDLHQQTSNIVTRKPHSALLWKYHLC